MRSRKNDGLQKQDRCLISCSNGVEEECLYSNLTAHLKVSDQGALGDEQFKVVTYYLAGLEPC